jgi:hypothetical protein
VGTVHLSLHLASQPPSTAIVYPFM